MADSFDPSNIPADALSFLTERHLATLTTLASDGSPQVTPVGVTYDQDRQLACVITWSTSRKAKNVASAPGQRVAVCQVDGGRWLTIYGVATVTDEPGAVAEAVRRYTDRYREPKKRTDRVVIEIRAERILGRA
ncbi:MAG: PPOX class probable F420-dependent enzyme [Acidimicrobiales bacterium]|jgi:F420H(2)-dependent biliverdin reductase